MPQFDERYLDNDVPWDEPSLFHGEEAGDALAATLAAIFATRGDDFAVGFLTNAKHRIVRSTYDNGNFWKYQWIIQVPASFYALYKSQELSDQSIDFDERSDFVITAWRLGGPYMNELHWSDIEIKPSLVVDPEWRDRMRGHLSGAGVNNQGNVMLSLRPKILHDELWFRHIEEQHIHEALLRRGNPFMPLPVVMYANGKKRPNGVNRRIEPDFCILFKGRLIVLEIDGGSHWETPVNAEQRVLFLREQGAIIRRIEAGPVPRTVWYWRLGDGLHVTPLELHR